MTSKSKYNGKSSPGILLTNPQSDVVKYRDKKVKLHIRESNKDADPRQVKDEEKKFAELKKLYLNQCAPINKQVVQSLAKKIANDTNEHIFRTSRVNQDSINKFKIDKNGQIVDKKIRNRDVSNNTISRVNRIEHSGRGCGAGGCRCISCTCDNCQVDCRCMRQK